VAALALSLFESRAEARLRLSVITRSFDEILGVGGSGLLGELVSGPLSAEDAVISLLGDRMPFSAFTLSEAQVRSDVLIPRYYAPEIGEQLAALSSSCELVSIGDLVSESAIEVETGDEVGKLAYGSGKIPFVRTSDFGNWELKQDPKQRVSEDTFTAYSSKQSVEIDDLLVVRDGTYLVGASALVCEADIPMLISGGIYRIRVRNRRRIDPFLLLALMNAPIVKRQMRSKQFTRDVIDTLGRRFFEVVLPIPRDTRLAGDLASLISGLLSQRAQHRVAASELGAIIEQGTF
jgi:hypothetical protein